MSFFTNLQYLIRPFIHTYIFFYILNTKYKIYRKEIYLIMKKSILFMPVLISLSIVGCTMNYNQPSSDKVIHQYSLNIDKLINANAADVEKSLGSPYYATYYIDADKLKSKNINSISIEDLKEDVSLLASYNDNQSSDSYLHIYYEDGVVKDALYGPYKIDNLDNVISASNISNADYKVSFFKNRGAICYNDFSIDNAKEAYLNCNILTLNKQKGVLSIEPNHGNAKSRNIFMDTYIMKKELFLDLIHKARAISSAFTLTDIINELHNDLDVRGISHRGFFASITDFQSY